MIETTARVPTANAAQYTLNICKQWGYEVGVDFRADRGVVHFTNAVATLTPSSDQLIVTILANDSASIERLQKVVASHLDWLTGEEAPLTFDWRSSLARSVCVSDLHPG